MNSVNRLQASAVCLAAFLIAGQASGGLEPSIYTYVDFVDFNAGGVPPQIYFAASSYDYYLGRLGSASTTFVVDGQYYSISCTGPELADAVSIDEKHGTVEVYVVLDPNATYCQNGDPPHNLTSPVVFELSGTPIAGYRNLEERRTRSWSPGSYSEANYTYNFYSVTLTGAAPLSYPKYMGYIEARRKTEKTKTK